MSQQPITLYGHPRGPNPWKVIIIMQELGIPYREEHLDMSVMKEKPFVDVNPNGRVPAIHDPSNNLTLWESGAIVEYLVEKYDTQHKLHFKDEADIYHAKQFLHFQMSGQGPYFGQAMWFMRYHPEKVPSAVERYQNEMRRVSKVLDNCLEGKEYLVGGKCSYADLCFMPWYAPLSVAMPEVWNDIKENKNFVAWWNRLHERPGAGKAMQDYVKTFASS